MASPATDPGARPISADSILDSSLITCDGIELATRSWLFEGRARATVVLVHGLSASKDHPNVVALATKIRSCGVDVISYDARGHGSSGGSSTLGQMERNDVAAAVERARSRHARVVVVGASMGAVAALSYAESDPDLAGVVLVSSPANWRIPLRVRALLMVALTRTKPGRAVAARRSRVRIHHEWNPTEPPRSIAKRVVTTVPLAIVHGRRDRLIPLDSSLSVPSTEIPGTHSVVVPGMGHAFDPAGHDAICNALDWILKSGEGAPIPVR